MPLRNLKIKASIKVALIYLLFALMWIIVSDEVVRSLFTDINMLTIVQTVKGWLFVSISAAIIYILLLREFHKLENALRRTKSAEENYGKLLQSATNGILISKNNQIQYANPFALDLFELNQEEINKLRLDNVIKPIDDNDFDFLKSLSLIKLKGFSTAKLIQKSGNFKYIEINTSNININDSDSLLLFFSDITDLVQAQADSFKQKSFFEQTFMQSANALCIFDENGDIYKVNTEFLRTFRLKAQDIKQFNILNEEIDDDSHFFKSIRSVFHEGQDFSCTTSRNIAQFISKKQIDSNKEHFYFWKMFPIIGKNDHIENVVLNVEDITDRVEASAKIQNTSEMLRSIVSNFPNGAVYLFDKDIRFIVADGQALQKLNWQKNMIEGKTLKEIGNQHLIDALEENYTKVFQSITSKFEMQFNGITFEVNTYPIKDKNENINYGLATAIDITQRKKHELEIMEFNAELEERIAHRTEQIQLTNKALQAEVEERMTVEEELLNAKENLEMLLENERAVNAMKSNFVSMVMHEYRTPLTVIQSSGYLIKEYNQAGDNQQVEKHVKRISETVQKLTVMLDELLYLGKSSVQRVNISKFDILMLLKEISEDTNLFHHRNAKLNMKPEMTSLMISSDKDRVERIFQNLISNAVKYSEDDIHIFLERFDDYFEVVIKDSGIGIPEADLDKLFEPFHRSSNAKLHKGTGLGLSIVKKAIDDLGGKISVKSTENVGTTFLVRLPIQSYG